MKQKQVESFNWPILDELKSKSSFVMDYSDSEREVLSCRRIESGLRFGAAEGVTACCVNAYHAPVYWLPNELKNRQVTKAEIIEKRKQLFELLNDKSDEVQCDCHKCEYVEKKKLKDVTFNKLWHLNVAHFSACNSRCDYCYFTQNDYFVSNQFDALAILKLFSKSDIESDAWVDYNGGEPTIMPDFDNFMDFFREYNIKVALFTNAFLYKESITRGLLDGTINIMFVSVDAGTERTHKLLKKRGSFNDVIKNLIKFSHDTRNSSYSPRLIIKYNLYDRNNINNFEDDDIYGFVRAMTIVVPTQIDPMFDFYPISDGYAEQSKVGTYDYSRHIEGMAKLVCIAKQYQLNVTTEYLDCFKHRILVDARNRMYARASELSHQYPVIDIQCCTKKNQNINYIKKYSQYLQFIEKIDSLIPVGSIRRELVKSIYYFMKFLYKVVMNKYKK